MTKCSRNGSPKILYKQIENPRKDGYYWPHFPVCRLDKATSKIRPVFDGVTKTGQSCINEHILQGPMLLNELAKVLMRFRRYDFVVAADISQMFLQIALEEQNKPFHRFLWLRENRLVIFQSNRHLFGNTGSPAVAISRIQINAKNHQSEFPQAAETVYYACLMDDMMDSRDDEDEAGQLATELVELFKRCAMRIVKFYSLFLSQSAADVVLRFLSSRFPRNVVRNRDVRNLESLFFEHPKEIGKYENLESCLLYTSDAADE